MSLNAKEIASLVKEVEARLAHQTVIACEEMGNFRFAIVFEGGALFFCLEEPLLRLHLTDKKGSPPKSAFVQNMQKWLTGTTFETISAIAEERIVTADFSHPKRNLRFSLVIELFSKKANGYLLDDQGEIIAAMKRTESCHYSLPKPGPTHKTPTDTLLLTSAAVEKEYCEREHQKKREALEALLRKKVSKAEKQCLQYQKLLAQAKEWESLHHEGELLQANLFKIPAGASSVTVDDWITNDQKSLTLDPKRAPHEEVANRFRKSKKLKKAIPHLEERIKAAKERYAHWQKLQQELTACEDKALLAFEEQHLLKELETPALIKAKKEKKALPYREFITAKGSKIWVGKSAKDNERLTFQYANGSDWWFHASEYSGSHVILRVPKGKNPHEEEIEGALQLALFYSKAKEQGAAEVVYTQKKYVSRQGQKKAGRVTLSHHKKQFVRVDREKIQQFKNSGTSNPLP